MKNFYNNARMKNWYMYTMVFISAILFTVGIQIFVQVASTFTAGLSAVALVPTMLVDSLAPYVSLIYLGLNIPLVVIFWRKIKKQFIYKTLFFLLVQASFGMLFINDDISKELKNLVVDPNMVFTQVWPIFLMSAIGALIIGSTNAIAWRNGGSSGGGDIITYYYSRKRKTSIGKVSFVISMMFVMISFIVSISISQKLRDNAFPILLATITYVAIASFVVNSVYPKYDKIQIEIHSEKIEQISKYLKKTKFVHSWQIRDVESGFNGKRKKVITTVALLLEFREIKKMIVSIDDKAWIATIRIKNLHGQFDTSSVD